MSHPLNIFFVILRSNVTIDLLSTHRIFSVNGIYRLYCSSLILFFNCHLWKLQRHILSRAQLWKAKGCCDNNDIYLFSYSMSQGLHLPTIL